MVDLHEVLLSRWRHRLTAQYGGKRAWLKHRWFSLLDGLGVYERYRSLEWKRVERLIFVCDGNICRSPYGEARAGALGLPASSFGITAEENNPANSEAIRVGRLRGLDLTPHRSRRLNIIECRPGDLLIAMEPSQARQLQPLAAQRHAQVTILGLWNRQPRPYLHDPYGLNSDYFSTCFALLDEAIERIGLELKDFHAKQTR